MEIILIILCIVILATVIFLFFKISDGNRESEIRKELSEGLRNNRMELLNSINQHQLSLSETLSKSAQVQNQWIEKLAEKVETKLSLVNNGLASTSKENREELKKSLKEFQDAFSENVKEFNTLQKQKFDLMGQKQEEMLRSTEDKLEKMRQTVDEKLHKTLEERLGQSFKLVSEQLQAVQKGLGEMQNLASGVGDLKKVLSNVKTRGVLGEIQLGNILEQILAPEQYAANVKTNKNSNDHVEYAIKLPGKDDNHQSVYLPIDAKFPQEDYYRLQTAYDAGDPAGVEQATKALLQSIKKFAKDISLKYLDPPYTTDFGIMFLPIEGLYAEVVRRSDLIETLQREHKIIVTGPTTLAALLNSLQMGFKTLAIQKRSGEVWEILGAVKTEFTRFGDVLKKAQSKIQDANKELDKLVTTRTNAINRKLRNVQELPSPEKPTLEDETSLDEFTDIIPDTNDKT